VVCHQRHSAQQRCADWLLRHSAQQRCADWLLRHSAQQRCADWLLRRSDQVGGRAFPLTQQFLASMLGLRRTTVSAVAASLQNLGLISYRYGQVAVRDHEGLERLACSCYGLFRCEVSGLSRTSRSSRQAPDGAVTKTPDRPLA